MAVAVQLAWGPFGHCRLSFSRSEDTVGSKLHTGGPDNTPASSQDFVGFCRRLQCHGRRHAWPGSLIACRAAFFGANAPAMVASSFTGRRRSGFACDCARLVKSLIDGLSGLLQNSNKISSFFIWSSDISSCTPAFMGSQPSVLHLELDKKYLVTDIRTGR